MPNKLHADSYKLHFEKIAALALGATCLWFGFGDPARNPGPARDAFGALKIGLCIVGGFVGVRIFCKGILSPAAACLLLVLVYNPFFDLPLSNQWWRAVHFASGLTFAWVLMRICQVSKAMTPAHVEDLRLSEARARTLALAGAKGDLASTPADPSPLPGKEGEGKENNQVIHFVLKDPPPGVPRTKENTVVTGSVVRSVDENGKRTNKVSIYKDADILTIIEAKSAIYWRDQIEHGVITDAQAVDWLHALEQHTVHDYIMASSSDPHPGEVAITSGLTQTSLHYAIIYLDKIGYPASTTDPMKRQEEEGLSHDRAADYERAVSFKDALIKAKFDTAFLTHVKASVTVGEA